MWPSLYCISWQKAKQAEAEKAFNEQQEKNNAIQNRAENGASNSFTPQQQQQNGKLKSVYAWCGVQFACLYGGII